MSLPIQVLDVFVEEEFHDVLGNRSLPTSRTCEPAPGVFCDEGIAFCTFQSSLGGSEDSTSTTSTSMTSASVSLMKR